MDDNRFDDLAKFIGEPATRRWAVRSLGGGTFGAVLGLLGLADAEAGKKRKKKKKKKKCPGSRQCGKNCCGKGQFCCDDARKVCCANNAECCNVGPGTGSCCNPPNRCAKPIGNDAAPWECCPPERQFTGFGVIRCCPGGTRSLGTEISSDDGPCCPEEKYCSTSQTGGKCCPDVAPLCLNRNTGQCCNEEATCGTTCCSGMFGDCCGGQCRLSEMGPWTDCGGFCCPSGQTCCGTADSPVCCGSSAPICMAPCGDLPAACCTQANIDSGHCCGSGDGGGG